MQQHCAPTRYGISFLASESVHYATLYSSNIEIASSTPTTCATIRKRAALVHTSNSVPYRLRSVTQGGRKL
jgi:hypothetical protein